MKKPGNYKIPYYDRKKELEGVPLASFWRRGLALTLDCAIVYVTIFALMILVGWILQGPNPRMLFVLVLYFKQVWSLQLIIDIIAALLYFGLFMYIWNGYTPGKRLMRVRVVSLKSKNITFWQSIDRAFLYMVSVLSLFFGFLRYFSNPARQTKHDKVVDTIVVDMREYSKRNKEDNHDGNDN
ncbi:MAG: RDD family protein [bacterium]|nr:RDD family protein [bacterium]